MSLTKNRPEVDDGRLSRFRRDLETLINRCSLENGSDTPDFLLAEYLSRSLSLFDDIVARRELWYERGTSLCDDDEPDPVRREDSLTSDDVPEDIAEYEKRQIDR